MAIENCINRIRNYLSFGATKQEICAKLVPEFGKEIVFLAYHAAVILFNQENK